MSFPTIIFRSFVFRGLKKGAVSVKIMSQYNLQLFLVVADEVVTTTEGIV